MKVGLGLVYVMLELELARMERVMRIMLMAQTLGIRGVSGLFGLAEVGVVRTEFPERRYRPLLISGVEAAAALAAWVGGEQGAKC